MFTIFVCVTIALLCGAKIAETSDTNKKIEKIFEKYVQPIRNLQAQFPDHALEIQMEWREPSKNENTVSDREKKYKYTNLKKFLRKKKSGYAKNRLQDSSEKNSYTKPDLLAMEEPKDEVPFIKVYTKKDNEFQEYPTTEYKPPEITTMDYQKPVQAPPQYPRLGQEYPRPGPEFPRPGLEYPRPGMEYPRMGPKALFDFLRPVPKFSIPAQEYPRAAPDFPLLFSNSVYSNPLSPNYRYSGNNFPNIYQNRIDKGNLLTPLREGEPPSEEPTIATVPPIQEPTTASFQDADNPKKPVYMEDLQRVLGEFENKMVNFKPDLAAAAAARDNAAMDEGQKPLLKKDLWIALGKKYASGGDCAGRTPAGDMVTDNGNMDTVRDGELSSLVPVAYNNDNVEFIHELLKKGVRIQKNIPKQSDGNSLHWFQVKIPKQF